MERNKEKFVFKKPMEILQEQKDDGKFYAVSAWIEPHPFQKPITLHSL